jgi:chitinase
VLANQLGGLFAWEIDADNGDILNAMHEGLGHGEGTLPPVNKPPVANAGSDLSATGRPR